MFEKRKSAGASVNGPDAAKIYIIVVFQPLLTDPIQPSSASVNDNNYVCLYLMNVVLA